MNTQTQEVPKEKLGHRGGRDGEHRCWRCALKKALALGALTAASSFVKDMGKVPIVEQSLRVASISEKEIGKMADAVHEIVIYLDSFSGRSTEVH